MEEHLREIRSLHRRLEESIQTNERLRQQLAERLGSEIQDGGLRKDPQCGFFYLLVITLLLINMNTSASVALYYTHSTYMK